MVQAVCTVQYIQYCTLYSPYSTVHSVPLDVTPRRYALLRSWATSLPSPSVSSLQPAGGGARKRCFAGKRSLSTQAPLQLAVAPSPPLLTVPVPSSSAGVAGACSPRIVVVCVPSPTPPLPFPRCPGGLRSPTPPPPPPPPLPSLPPCPPRALAFTQFLLPPHIARPPPLPPLCEDTMMRGRAVGARGPGGGPPPPPAPPTRRCW